VADREEFMRSWDSGQRRHRAARAPAAYRVTGMLLMRATVLRLARLKSGGGRPRWHLERSIHQHLPIESVTRRAGSRRDERTRLTLSRSATVSWEGFCGNKSARLDVSLPELRGQRVEVHQATPG